MVGDNDFQEVSVEQIENKVQGSSHLAPMGHILVLTEAVTTWVSTRERD